MKKIFLATIMITLMTAISAHADTDIYNVKCEGDNIVISGTLDRYAQYVALELLEEGYAFGQELPADITKTQAIPFLQQQELSKGSREFKFEFPCGGESRKLNACLNGEGFSQPLYFTVNYIKNSDFQAVLADLKNNLSTKDSFIGFLESGNNAMILNCDEMPQEADAEKVREIMYNSLKTSASDIKKADDTKLMWREAILISLFNDGEVSDIKLYANYLNLSDSEVLKWYNHAVQLTGGSEKLTKLLSNTKYTVCSDFETMMKKALVLTVVRYPNGAANIGKVLNDFADVTGVTQTGELDKYAAFAGKDYSDYESFINSFKQYTPNVTTGGGSSGTGSGSSRTVISGMTSGGFSQQTVEMGFIDLDTVPWAYKAIATLSDKKIISGRSENRFAPDDSITREEFAKLCVCMLSMDSRTYESHFSDVPSDEWYTKYINIAYEAGICAGISEGVFGVGRPVTRQDMAVMIYNMLKLKGVSADTAAAEFADWNEVSEYAKEAVSALVNRGTVSGMGDNTFSPKTTATRAQAAVMLFGVVDSLR